MKIRPLFFDGYHMRAWTFVAIVLLCVYVIVRAVTGAVKPFEIVRGESIRNDLATMRGQIADHAVGKAVEWNAGVAQYKKCNANFVCNIFVPDWTDVDAIEIP